MSKRKVVRKLNSHLRERFTEGGDGEGKKEEEEGKTSSNRKRKREIEKEVNQETKIQSSEKTTGKNQIKQDHSNIKMNFSFFISFLM